MIADRQHQSRLRGVLSLWTVYDHPDDFPHSFVARRWETGGGGLAAVPTDDIIQGDLDVIRKSFEVCGLTCLKRNESDDPKILETWL